MFIPIGGLISTEANILGILGIDEIINLSALTVIIIQKRKFKLEKNHLNQLAISLILIYLVYLNYCNFKNSFVEIENVTYFVSIKRLIKSVVLYIPIIYLVQLLRLKHFRDAVILGVKFSIVLLAITTIFSSYIDSYNLSSITYLEKTEVGEIVRTSGIFSCGGINALGNFFVIAIGFFLSIVEREKNLNKYIFFIAIAIIGVLFTGSRTAITGLTVISIIFIFRNYKRSAGLKFFLLIVLGFLILEPFVVSVLVRFYDSNKQIEGEEGSRLFKWVLYVNYIIENPRILLWGIDHPFWYRRGVHNFFLEIIFNSGLIIFTIFIYRYIRIIYTAIKRLKEYNIIYMVIPVFFICMFNGGFDYAVYFYIFVSMNPYLNQKKTYDKVEYSQNTTIV